MNSALSTQHSALPKPHGNAIPEPEFRARILRAIAILAVEEKPVIWLNLRAAGVRGNDRRIRETVEALRRDGLIAPHLLLPHKNRDMDPITAMRDVDRARRDPAEEDRQAIARERSAEWVAEHDARMRRLRRLSRQEAVGSGQ